MAVCTLFWILKQDNFLAWLWSISLDSGWCCATSSCLECNGLIIAGLPQTGSWQDLKDHMREAGDICYADVFHDGTGVVEFVRYEDMKYAVKKLDDTKFKSHEVRIHITNQLKECLLSLISPHLSWPYFIWNEWLWSDPVHRGCNRSECSRLRSPHKGWWWIQWKPLWHGEDRSPSNAVKSLILAVLNFGI